jgi:hypothetical protein
LLFDLLSLSLFDFDLDFDFDFEEEEDDDDDDDDDDFAAVFAFFAAGFASLSLSLSEDEDEDEDSALRFVPLRGRRDGSATDGRTEANERSIDATRFDFPETTRGGGGGDRRGSRGDRDGDAEARVVESHLASMKTFAISTRSASRFFA